MSDENVDVSCLGSLSLDDVGLNRDSFAEAMNLLSVLMRSGMPPNRKTDAENELFLIMEETKKSLSVEIKVNYRKFFPEIPFRIAYWEEDDPADLVLLPGALCENCTKKEVCRRQNNADPGRKYISYTNFRHINPYGDNSKAKNTVNDYDLSWYDRSISLIAPLSNGSYTDLSVNRTSLKADKGEPDANNRDKQSSSFLHNFSFSLRELNMLGLSPKFLNHKNEGLAAKAVESHMADLVSDKKIFNKAYINWIKCMLKAAIENRTTELNISVSPECFTCGRSLYYEAPNNNHIKRNIKKRIINKLNENSSLIDHLAAADHLWGGNDTLFVGRFDYNWPHNYNISYAESLAVHHVIQSYLSRR